MPRTALAALLLVLAAPRPVWAQVQAPRLVEETDEPADEPAEPAQPPAAEPAPAAVKATPAAPAPAGSPDPAAPAAPAAPAPGAPAAAAPAPGAAAPTPLPARKVLPVRTSWAALMTAWSDRRAALRDGDPGRAAAAESALRAAQRELGIENLFALASAEVREVSRALAANLPDEALRRAELAVSLSPDLPEAHVALARARLSAGAWREALGALLDAGEAALREPRAARALLADLLAALLGGVAGAAVLTLVVLAAVRVRLFLHDLHHLPILRGSARVQSAFLGLVLLGMPLALGLGPMVALAVLALAVWLYLTTRERVVVAAALAALLALPSAAGWAARQVAWTGTLADRVYELEHGALPDDQAEALLAEAGEGNAPPVLVAALARHAKRRGELDRALALYRQAMDADPHAPELLVNMGNVLFVKDDVDGARASYLAAQDAAGGDRIVLGTAHYDLAKIYVRTGELDRRAAARAKAEAEAGEFLAGRGSEDDFAANRYLVDVPIPRAKLEALAAADPASAAVEAALQARLAGPLPRPLWRWAAAGLFAILAALLLLERRLAPARACTLCGGAACVRCDRNASARCAQCVNVFDRKGVVDASDRRRKGLQVKRRGALARLAVRALAVVSGGAGHLVSGAPVRGALLTAGIGAALLWIATGRGLLPPPDPWPAVAVVKGVLGGALAAGLWALGVRGAFRRTGG